MQDVSLVPQLEVVLLDAITCQVFMAQKSRSKVTYTMFPIAVEAFNSFVCRYQDAFNLIAFLLNVILRCPHLGIIKLHREDNRKI